MPRAGQFNDVKVITNVAFTSSPTWKFGYTTRSLILQNDSFQHDVIFSFDGRNEHGRVRWFDEQIEFEGIKEARIWLKSSHADGVPVEITAWDGSSSIQKRKKFHGIAGRTGDTLHVNPDGSFNVIANTPASEINLKQLIMCAEDVIKNYTWQEIDGIYRITELLAESVFISNIEGQTTRLKRTFEYDAADPFNLKKITDEIIVVP